MGFVERTPRNLHTMPSHCNSIGKALFLKRNTMPSRELFNSGSALLHANASPKLPTHVGRSRLIIEFPQLESVLLDDLGKNFAASLIYGKSRPVGDDRPLAKKRNYYSCSYPNPLDSGGYPLNYDVFDEFNMSEVAFQFLSKLWQRRH